MTSLKSKKPQMNDDPGRGKSLRYMISTEKLIQDSNRKVRGGSIRKKNSPAQGREEIKDRTGLECKKKKSL